MNLRRLFKTQTAVVRIVITLALAFGASYLGGKDAQAANGVVSSNGLTTELAHGLGYNPCANPNSDQCKLANKEQELRIKELEQRVSQRGTERCEDAIKEYSTNRKEFKSNCSGSILKCMEKSRACNDDVTERGTAQMAALAFDPSGCAQALTSTKCPELNAGTTKSAKDDKKDLEDRKKDAQGKLEDLMKDSQDLTAKAETSLQDLKEKQQESERTLRDEQMKISDQLAATISGLKDEKTKAYRAARAEYTKIDEEYLKMRDQVRRDTSAVAAAKADLQRVCREYAMKMYSQADQQLNQRIAEEQSRLINQGSITTAAGGTKRKAKKAEKQRSMNYAGYFKDCLNGVAPEGTAALNKIADLENTQKDNQAMLVDKAALLEKQRAEVLQQIQELEASATEKQNSATQQAQQRLQTLQQDYLQLQQSNQEKYLLAQQQLQREQALLNQRMANQNQELQKLDSEIMIANTKVMCAQSNGGNMSESAGDRRRDRIDKAMEALSGLQDSCLVVERVCTGNDGQIEAVKKSCDVYKDPELEGEDDYTPVSSKPAPKRSKPTKSDATQ